jgi:two-component system, LuxR family, response regulator FixJ
VGEKAHLQEYRELVVSIVDDDESVRRSVRNLLLSVGLRVEVFESGKSFMGSPQRSYTGCLVLDLRMPEMDGLDLLAHLEEAGEHIPAVILTAHGDDEVRERARRAGVVAFLDKPVKSAVLIEGVQSALLRATGGSSVDES